MEQRNAANWRAELPRLRGRTVELREPATQDLGPLVDLFSFSDAPRFGLAAPVTELAIQRFIDLARQHRAAGVGFTYVITLGSQHAVVGLIQVRQLDMTFETAEWECMLVPSSRGTGVFVEATRLVGSFTFNSVGTHRLESRVLLENGRANGALQKIGATQEGILRRSVRRGDDYLDQVLWAVLREDWRDRPVLPAARVH
jgi:[ribosomal protein S5]-alanine N-acetyltransferase